MQQVESLVALCKPQLQNMQAVLHETIKDNLAYMPVLNQLWSRLDATLYVLDILSQDIELERERQAFLSRRKPQQVELPIEETDAYYRQLANDIGIAGS